MTMEKFTLPFEEPIRELEQRIEALRAGGASRDTARQREIRELVRHKDELIQRTFSNLPAWDRVRIARHPSRPTSAEYVGLMFQDFVDIHGDRRFGDDKAILAGFASLDGERIVFLGQQKGRTTKEKLICNFGMPHPEGYRKALRVMKLAEKFQLPVVTFVDTMGAYPGVGSEERGVAEAIAVNLREMSRLRTPLVSIVIGEGGSGGALGLGTGDRLIMLEYAYYSVISPEGCAAILWRSGDEAPKAADALRLTAPDLEQLGIVDETVPEPAGGAHNDPEAMTATLRKVICRNLRELGAVSMDRLLELRYEKYRRMGYYVEGGREWNPVEQAAADAKATSRRKARRPEAPGLPRSPTNGTAATKP